MNRSSKNMANVLCKRNRVRFHSAFTPLYSRLSIRHRASGFTLIEILIAIFVFLIGILGVLSMFPVAMNSASRTMGQVRGNILAQGTLSQLTADCKVPYMKATVRTVLAPNHIACELSDVYGSGVDDEWNGYHVSQVLSDGVRQSRLINDTEQVAVVTSTGTTSGATLFDSPAVPWAVDEYAGSWVLLTSGPESGERRFITGNDGASLTLDSAFDTDPMVALNYQILETRLYVCPDWNPALTVGDEVTVTRMALPVPLRGTVDGTTSGTSFVASDVTWVDGQWDGYYLTMLSGTKENVSRRITLTTNPSTLTLDVAFAPPDPASGDEFIITRTPCGSRSSGTLTVDPGNPNELQDTDSTWLDDEWNDYYVRIVTSDDALNECRRISDTDDANDLLFVSPDWDAAKEPNEDDTYVIIPPPRNGYIRSIVGETIHAGLNSGEDVIPLTWNTGWAYSVKASDTCPADSLASTLEVTAADAGVADRGQVVVITGDPETNPAAGQVRIITDTNGGASPLTVFPDWEVLPTSSDDYEIRDRLGYFLVITSGRATNRTFLITGYNKNDVDGDEITCAGADFRDIGVTEAKLGATSSDYKVRNATSFMIVGPDEMISSLVSHTGTGMVPATVGPNDHGYLLNSFGIAKNAEPQTGTDFFFEAGTERETSEYSSVCIFSDAGSLSKGPVRADIVVYRNFNRAFPLPENRKPVGFLTGYIGRP